MAETLESICDFFESEFKPGLNGTQRNICVSGNFTLTHALVEGQIDRLLLGRRKAGNNTFEHFVQIMTLNVVVNSVIHPGIGLSLGFVLKSFLGPSVALAFPKPINRSTPGERDHPS